MKDNKTVVELLVKPRPSNEKLNNLYVVIDGHDFEVVPHCRTKMETAYFYALLKNCDLKGND